MPIEFDSDALKELEEAAGWYDRQRDGLGREFLDTVYKELGRIGSGLEPRARYRA